MILPFDLAKAVNLASKSEEPGDEDLSMFVALITSLQEKLNADSGLKNQKKLVLISSANADCESDGPGVPDSVFPGYVTSPYGEINLSRKRSLQRECYIETVMPDLQNENIDQVRSCFMEHQRLIQQYVELLPEQSPVPESWTLCISSSSVIIKTNRGT